MLDPTAVDKRGRTIRDMFAGVAPRYDLLNRLLSGTLDVIWRRRAARALDPTERRCVLDLCCGTGDQATALHRRGAAVLAADFCVPMLALARRKFRSRAETGSQVLAALAADALHLPFASASFTGVTVAFGLRNVADLERALDEIARVLAPGGRLVVLEFTLPQAKILSVLYLFYFRHILPRIGAALSPRGSAYSYLPSSVVGFPQREELLEHLGAAGLTDLSYEPLTGGTLCLYSGRKPQ